MTESLPALRAGQTVELTIKRSDPEREITLDARIVAVKTRPDGPKVFWRYAGDRRPSPHSQGCFSKEGDYTLSCGEFTISPAFPLPYGVQSWRVLS